MIAGFESLIRVRMSTSDVHYAGGLVDGARLLQLCNDAVTEVLIRHDGDEGLLRAMESEHLAPVFSGDFLEFRARLVAVGKSSRTLECMAHKVIQLEHPDNSAARLMASPALVLKARCTVVVPLHKQKAGARSPG